MRNQIEKGCWAEMDNDLGQDRFSCRHSPVIQNENCSAACEIDAIRTGHNRWGLQEWGVTHRCNSRIGNTVMKKKRMNEMRLVIRAVRKVRKADHCLNGVNGVTLNDLFWTVARGNQVFGLFLPSEIVNHRQIWQPASRFFFSGFMTILDAGNRGRSAPWKILVVLTVRIRMNRPR